MRDPITIGDGVFDRAEIVGVLPQDSDVLIFLRGGKVVTIHESLSREEIDTICDIS